MSWLGGFFIRWYGQNKTNLFSSCLCQKILTYLDTYLGNFLYYRIVSKYRTVVVHTVPFSVGSNPNITNNEPIGTGQTLNSLNPTFVDQNQTFWTPPKIGWTKIQIWKRKNNLLLPTQTHQKSRIIILGTGFNPTLSSLILASHCNLTFIIIDRWFLVT